MHGFVDAGWARDMDHKIYTSGYAFNLFAGAIGWMSKKHDLVALSTIEFEYMASTHTSKEVVWLKNLCS